MNGGADPVQAGRDRSSATAAVILILAAVVSVFASGIPAPQTVPQGGLMAPGGISALMEQSLGTGAAVLFKVASAFILLVLLKKKSPVSAVPLAAVVCLLPASGESLALPLAAVMGVGPLWALIAAALALPFFSKLALVAMLLAIVIRFIAKGKNAGALAPLAGLLSPPIMASVLGGDLFLPFYLSISSFPPYGPVKLLSPLFPLFLLSAAWLFLDGDIDMPKSALALGSFFFGPLATLPAVFPASSGKDKHFMLKVLFCVPVIWALAFPQKQPVLPDDFKEALSALRGSTATVAAPPQYHDEVASILQRKEGKGVFPSASFGDLSSYCADAPLAPPFTGHRPPFQADLLIAEARYPKTASRRPFISGWKTILLGEDLALFASKELSDSPVGLKPIEHYNPYNAPPADEKEKRLALAEVESILQRSPRFGQALKDSGKLHLDLGEPEKAEKRFREALAFEKTAELYNDLGVSLANEGKYDEAMAEYLNAMKLAPKDIFPRMNYASAAMSAGKSDEAKMVLGDIVRAYPTFFPAIRFLSQIYGKEGDVEKAKEILALIPREQRTQSENELMGAGK